MKLKANKLNNNNMQGNVNQCQLNKMIVRNRDTPINE